MASRYDKVYAFTNENVSSFEGLYNFNGAKVLSVIGSGDQYFASLLYGAEDITLYDFNPESWYFFVLKFYALMILSYEEFFEFGGSYKFDDKKTLEKIIPYLPKYVRDHLIEFIKENGGLNNLVLYSSLSNYISNYRSGRVIPYFNKESYEILQNKLRNTKLPRVFIADLLDLPSILDREQFDIILTSNIFNWLSLSPKEYLRFLKKFRAEIIQVWYAWNSKNENIQKFADLGLVVDEVPSVISLYDDKNYVISKR